MNLLDLTIQLANPHSRDAFFLDHRVDTTSEHLSIYMHGAPGLETAIALLGVEETDEVLDYYKDGAHWVNFLPLYMVEEIVEGGVAAHKSPVEIATRVLEYARNDA
ncbi:hypothetical protein [Hymenobacter persicinus]|uniref:Uncharacterized protein n=1 Tax=Hymenobacter persicinus TaxID=2025506 RepID=A0A4V1ZAQ4_9BACT|nr:hypothetical protein [Hymenobacter persicinus]RYU79288.1 hypothetical protein EWM57_11115 [Hymenobacter persicinus]